MGRFKKNIISIVPAIFTPLLGIMFSGCDINIVPNPVVYSLADIDSPHSVLRFDNRITDAPYTWKSSVYIEVLVDGKQPTKRHYIPDGVTILRLAPGEHTIMHRAVMKQSGPYYSDIVVMKFDAVERKTYSIRFDYSGTILQGAYDATYEGWSENKMAEWPIRNETYRH